MKILNFSVRVNIKKDNPIKVRLKASDDHYAALFYLGSDDKIIGDKSSIERYYTTPYLLISREIENRLAQAEDTKSFDYVRNYVSIVHELTHYFQVSSLSNRFFS